MVGKQKAKDWMSKLHSMAASYELSEEEVRLGATAPWDAAVAVRACGAVAAERLSIQCRAEP